MPRIQPPRGYYTATETKQLLNISDAMVRIYVQKGKITYLLPPGRKHGFYLKKDVDKLANELHAFLHLDEEAEVTEFTAATVADIPVCIALNRELFDISSTGDDQVLISKWTQWLDKNPEIVHVLKRNKAVVGIATMLPFKPDSEKFKDILGGDVSILLGDVNILPEDIEEYQAGNHIQLYVAEIGMKPSLDKDVRRRLGAKLISKFIETIVSLGQRGVVIERVVAVGATRSGIRLLQHFGFNEVVFPRPDTRLFTITVKDSEVRLIRQYKQALAEYQEHADSIKRNGQGRKKSKSAVTSAANTLQEAEPQTKLEIE